MSQPHEDYADFLRHFAMVLHERESVFEAKAQHILNYIKSSQTLEQVTSSDFEKIFDAFFVGIDTRFASFAFFP